MAIQAVVLGFCFTCILLKQQIVCLLHSAQHRIAKLRNQEVCGLVIDLRLHLSPNAQTRNIAGDPRYFAPAAWMQLTCGHKRRPEPFQPSVPSYEVSFVC